MAVTFSKYLLHTSIGDMVVPYITGNLNETFNFFTDAVSIESSGLGSWSDTNKGLTFSGITEPFYILGKNGRYLVKPTVNTNQITYTLYNSETASSSGIIMSFYINSEETTSFTVVKLVDLNTVGIGRRTFFLSNVNRFKIYDYSMTQGSSNSFNHYIFTWLKSDPSTLSSPSIGAAITDIINNGEVYGSDEDPYNNPGEGSFDDGSSDSIGIPSLPSLSVADTGFITLYNPSAAGLKSLANYLWSDLFSLDTFKKLFVDPMSAILGLSILPVPIPSSGSRAVTVGNVSTGVSLPVASQQFIEVNCGSITLERQSPGTYLDFSPYTKVDIYLPFIGTHPLNVDEVMGRSINVTYHVDILSGACTAYVKVGSSVLYQFIGSCAISVPITGNDWTQAINGVMNIAGAIGSMVMTGGATAPMAAGAVASTAVNSLKPNVEKSGAVSGAGGLLAVKRPYLIINRPNRNVAKNQNKYIGYPAWKTMTLGDLDGYNSIEDVHLKNIPATETEIVEIERLLKEGVIF